MQAWCFTPCGGCSASSSSSDGVFIVKKHILLLRTAEKGKEIHLKPNKRLDARDSKKNTTKACTSLLHDDEWEKKKCAAHWGEKLDRERKKKPNQLSKKITSSSSALIPPSRLFSPPFVSEIGNYVYFYAQNAPMQCNLDSLSLRVHAKFSSKRVEKKCLLLMFWCILFRKSLYTLKMGYLVDLLVPRCCTASRKRGKIALGFRVFYRRSTYICWDVACAPHWMGCWLYHMRTFSSMWVGFVAPLCSVFCVVVVVGGKWVNKKIFFTRIKNSRRQHAILFWPWQAHTFAWVHCVYRRRAIT